MSPRRDGNNAVHADDRDAIAQLKARYFRGVDTRDWPMLRAVFADDAKIGPMENGLPAHVAALQPSPTPREPGESDVDAFMTRVAAFLDGVVSVHHGHQPEIVFTGADTADGVWAMEDVLVWPRHGYRFRGTGHYRETYVRVEGEWRIASTRLTRLYAYVEEFASAG